MDICARVLEAAAAMIEDGGLEQALALAARYAGWDGPEAKAMLGSDLGAIFDRVLAEEVGPQPRLERQEIRENFVNRFA